MIRLGFKKIHPDARLPQKAHPSDAGMDVYALETIRIAPFEPILVRTGLIPDIPLGYELQVRPRSGLALKSGITVWNSPGTIDAGYKSEIGVILFWTPYTRKDGIAQRIDEMIIKKGDRIAQFVLAPVIPCETCEVEDVGSSDRGTGGFGSTGI